jgi:DNA polymerase I-like protein with 3'-5' exonuclease and polymerase domains
MQGIQLQRLEALKDRLPREVLRELHALERPACPAAFPERLRRSAPAACRKAAALLRIYANLEPCLKTEGLLAPLLEVEMPLVPVLARMQALGIAVDTAVLAAHRAPLRRRVAELQEELCAAAGTRFDAASPAEVARVLFDHLGLEVPACAVRPRQRHLSTCDEVLEELAWHPVPRLLQEHRTLRKLLADFIDNLHANARRASFGTPGQVGGIFLVHVMRLF